MSPSRISLNARSLERAVPTLWFLGAQVFYGESYRAKLRSIAKSVCQLRYNNVSTGDLEIAATYYRAFPLTLDVAFSELSKVMRVRAETGDAKLGRGARPCSCRR